MPIRTNLEDDEDQNRCQDHNRSRTTLDDVNINFVVILLICCLLLVSAHQDNMSVCFIPPYTPSLYSKTGVYRSIHYFLIFALKHILWVLVRTASLRRFLRVPTIYVLSKNMKKVKDIKLKIVIFTAVKNRCILHGHVFVMIAAVFSFCVSR